jgi:hypothetical protein
MPRVGASFAFTSNMHSSAKLTHLHRTYYTQHTLFMQFKLRSSMKMKSLYFLVFTNEGAEKMLQDHNRVINMRFYYLSCPSFRRMTLCETKSSDVRFVVGWLVGVVRRYYVRWWYKCHMSISPHAGTCHTLKPRSWVATKTYLSELVGGVLFRRADAVCIECTLSFCVSVQQIWKFTASLTIIVHHFERNPKLCSFPPIFCRT